MQMLMLPLLLMMIIMILVPVYLRELCCPLLTAMSS